MPTTTTSWSSRALVVSAVILAGLARSDAQDRQAAGQGQPTFRVEANFVRVDVYPTVNGKAVRDLTAADFELLENGTPQKIETFEHVEVRGGGPQEARREPNTVQEGRSMAEREVGYSNDVASHCCWAIRSGDAQQFREKDRIGSASLENAGGCQSNTHG